MSRELGAGGLKGDLNREENKNDRGRELGVGGLHEKRRDEKEQKLNTM